MRGRRRVKWKREKIRDGREEMERGRKVTCGWRVREKKREELRVVRGERRKRGRDKRDKERSEKEEKLRRDKGRKK